MSLLSHKRQSDKSSFPRVSGDEPLNFAPR